MESISDAVVYNRNKYTATIGLHIADKATVENLIGLIKSQGFVMPWRLTESDSPGIAWELSLEPITIDQTISLANDLASYLEQVQQLRRFLRKKLPAKKV